MKTLSIQKLITPLGSMTVLSDNQFIYLLDFSDHRDLKDNIIKIKQQTKSEIINHETPTFHSIKKELDFYFEGQLREFKTPTAFFGSPFQVQVWDALKKIPYGETQSYSELANTIGKKTAHRAVANANGANRLTIIVPCHRVIASNGTIGGYSGGASRKQQLLDLER